MIPNTEYLPEVLRKSKQAGQIPNTNSGFTLIELLVTIFLVSVGLVGAMSFFNANIASQMETKNEVIAAGLAQEVPELVRNIVDYNYLNGNSWWKNIVVNSNASNALNTNCKSIDYTSLSSHDCISGNKTQVCLENNSQYTQGNSNCAGKTMTSFIRKLDVQAIAKDGSDCMGPPNTCDLEVAHDCLNVIATVTWSDKQTQATDIICKPTQ